MKQLHLLLYLSTALLLSGCAGALAFREGKSLLADGNTEQGLSRLEEAVRLEPRNAEYRITLVNRRDAIAQQLLLTAEVARREQRWGDAQAVYERLLKLDPTNLMARQGLEVLAVERRHESVVTQLTKILEVSPDADLTQLQERLRPVLSENSRHKNALVLKARIERARKGRAASTQLSKAYQKPVTLEFRDAPLRSVFDVISQVSGLSFVFDSDVRPDLRATVRAKDTSIDDAINLLLVTNQLARRVLNENSILIYPATAQKLRDYQTLLVRTFYVTNADIKVVANTLKTIVKVRDITLDERLGLIIVRDTPEVIRMAERIVALQDISDPEVMLEVEVLEIKRSRLLELGIRWPSQLTLSPVQTAGVPFTVEALRNLGSATTEAKIGSFVLNARKEDQDGNILANPRIRVRNKEKAKILIGDRLPVITTTSTSTGFVSESVNYLDVGLKLEVEPNIYTDDEVAIKINLEVSSLAGQITSKTGTVAYQVGTRGASTVLRLKDGETQVLAGLINNEDRMTANKVPGLGELPVLGRLFGSQLDDSQRTEILLSITPRVVRSLRPVDINEAEFDSGTEGSLGARPLNLQVGRSEAPLSPAMPDPLIPAPSIVMPQPPARPPSSTPPQGARPFVPGAPRGFVPSPTNLPVPGSSR